MNKCIVVLVILAIAFSYCEAGLLRKFGETSKTVGESIYSGTIKAEEKLLHLKDRVFYRNSESLAAHVITDDDNEDSAAKKDVQKKKNPSTAYIITDDDDDVVETSQQPLPTEKNVESKENNKEIIDPNHRHIIEGAIRCAPGEIFALNECRPVD
ncbi:hypothetical protein TKK_0007293 [Trichogramma kaykai]